MQKYGEMKDAAFHWMFDMEPKITQHDYSLIKPFTEGYATLLWKENICAARHLMLSDKSDWVNALPLASYNWMDDWNAGNIKGMSRFLSDSVPINTDETIWFFWMEESGVETTWGVFSRNWINFLYEDEAPILYCPALRYAIKFVVTGAVYMGEKPL